MTTNNNTNNNAEQQNNHASGVSMWDGIADIFTAMYGEESALDVRYCPIIEAGLKARSSLLSKIEGICLKLITIEKEKERLSSEYGTIPAAYLGDLQTMEDEATETRLKCARALYKSIDIKQVFDSVYSLSAYLREYCLAIHEALRYAKESEGKKQVSKAVTHTEAVEFVRALVEGDKPRSNGFAKDLKHAALLIAFRKSQGNPSEFVDVDEALNKVYASARRQGKKNGDDLGGKSNNPTKTACKALVLEALLRMIDNHEYKFDVIIGEASNK